MHDLIPADELFDEDGEMVIPELLHGKAVALKDGEYLVGDTLVETEGYDPVQFGAADLDVGLDFCRDPSGLSAPPAGQFSAGVNTSGRRKDTSCESGATLREWFE